MLSLIIIMTFVMAQFLIQFSKSSQSSFAGTAVLFCIALLGNLSGACLIRPALGYLLFATANAARSNTSNNLQGFHVKSTFFVTVQWYGIWCTAVIHTGHKISHALPRLLIARFLNGNSYQRTELSKTCFVCVGWLFNFTSGVSVS